MEISHKNANRIILINRVLLKQFSIHFIDSFILGINVNYNILPKNIKNLCKWNIGKNIFYIHLLIKDIKSGEIFFITLQVKFCKELNNIKESNILFHLNNIKKKIILDKGDSSDTLKNLNNFLKITIPYQKIWYDQYSSLFKNINNHKLLFNTKILDNFSSKNIVKHSNNRINNNNNKLIKKTNLQENFIVSSYNKNMSSSTKSDTESYPKHWDNQCDWSPDAHCLPSSKKYKPPKEYENPRYPVPQCCSKFKLDNKKTTLIKKEGSNNEYIYVDGRKFLIDKSDINKCYTAAYWLDPKIRDNCSTNYKNKIDLSNKDKIEIDEACFREIPTECGYNSSKFIPFNELNDPNQKIMALDCNKAIKPSQKTEASKYVTKEANHWINKSLKNKMLYNTKTVLSGSKYNEIENKGNLLQHSIRTHNDNLNTIKNLRAEILSKQRQVEISNDETLKINDRLFFLRLLFYYLIISLIPIVLSFFFKDTITSNVILGFILIVTIIMVIITIFSLYSIRNRHPDRWPLKQWRAGDLPEKDDVFPKNKPQHTIEKEQTYPPESDYILDEETEYTSTPEYIQPNKPVENKIIKEGKNKYQCNLVETKAPDVSYLENDINTLNKQIKNCNTDNKAWVNRRDKLKLRLCKAKGISKEDCMKYKLEELN